MRGDDHLLLIRHKFEKGQWKYSNKLDLWLTRGENLDEVGYPYGLHYQLKYSIHECNDHQYGYHRCQFIFPLCADLDNPTEIKKPIDRKESV
ncbi:hypothetical protein [Niallia sp. MER TA 168]|uniref:hypothetical protein n=1 Tax=Niallia sp. MER TA 168 TaxID=2939568 RepID=UPI002040EB43|nr:hypothetical protein [Niallia sp. MER TA 168]